MITIRDHAGAGPDPFIERCAIFWRARLSTLQIAQCVGTDEATIWNRMDQIKAAARGK